MSEFQFSLEHWNKFLGSIIGQKYCLICSRTLSIVSWMGFPKLIEKIGCVLFLTSPSPGNQLSLSLSLFHLPVCFLPEATHWNLTLGHVNSLGSFSYLCLAGIFILFRLMVRHICRGFGNYIKNIVTFIFISRTL